MSMTDVDSDRDFMQAMTSNALKRGLTTSQITRSKLFWSSIFDGAHSLVGLIDFIAFLEQKLRNIFRLCISFDHPDFSYHELWP
jgi:hypothetical protein